MGTVHRNFVACCHRILDAVCPRSWGPETFTCQAAVAGAPIDCGDLTSACADPPNTVVQGKAHCPLVEDAVSGYVYFGTHCGYYTEVDGMRRPFPEQSRSNLVAIS